MSRRDTIIIAVLVNAALLMILFATAMRTDDSKEDAKSKNGQPADLALAPGMGTNHAAPLQDALLNEFVTSVPTLAEAGGESLFPFDESEMAMASVPTGASPAQSHAYNYTTNDPFPAAAPSSVAVAPSSERQESQFVNVTVKKGDFLEKIAKANNTSVAAIMKTNNLSSTQLKIGQVLKLPLTKGDKKPTAPASSPQSAPTQGGDYYIVKEGDNPWLIASRNKINLQELLRLNGLDDQKAKRLRPGDKLKIR